MQNQTDPYLDIQNRITGQIGALAEALPHCALAQIVRGIDDIRCLARDNGFAAVETLASRLESAVAGGGYRAAILTLEPALKGLRHRDGAGSGRVQEARRERCYSIVTDERRSNRPEPARPAGCRWRFFGLRHAAWTGHRPARRSLPCRKTSSGNHDASIPSGQALSRRDERRGAGAARTDAGRGARGLAGVGGDAARALTPNA